MKFIKILFFLKLLTLFAFADEPVINSTDIYKLPYEIGYFHPRIFLHSLVNYYYDPNWQKNWYENFYKTNSLLLSVGSITTDKLSINANAKVSEKLNNNWWFFADAKMHEERERELTHKHLFLGFGRNVFKNTTAFIQFNPHYDKEFTDSYIGLKYENSENNLYFKTGLVIEDFPYDEKNDLGGKQNQSPYSFPLEFSFKYNNLSLYSDLWISTPYIRNYPDSLKSNGKSVWSQSSSSGDIGFFYEFDRYLLQAGAKGCFFYEHKMWHDSKKDYIYKNKIFNLYGSVVTSLVYNQRLRVVANFVTRNVESEINRTFEMKREEVIPALFYEYLIKNHVVELGYMVSFHRYKFESNFDVEKKNQSNYSDKAKLGYSFIFNNNSIIQLSLSQVITASRFGGGNLQYKIFF